ncbi:MAG: xanthine dehydrogenase accessory protein XdhC [Burkholderiales bacterium]|nr:xanthine dehydrogenase accessory protein XdhC [Burkholderiales bacterium]
MLDHDLLREIERLRQEGTAFCLATIVDARGSIPQVVGAAAIFTRAGLAHGTVGGGRLEAMCEERARALLADDSAARTRFERVNLQRDLGMTCGGEVALYFEANRRLLDWNIAVFGAGHVAQTLCRFLVELDCRVVCIDTREEWLDRLPRSAKLEAVKVADYTAGIDRIAPGADVLLMTMGHSADLPILKAIAARELDIAHLGLIGSDAKSSIVRRQLTEASVRKAFIDRIVCPVGEKLGDNTPAEIAVGIVSQLLKLRQAVRA